ncbi:MAG TPA: hypothetical protein P5137_01555, partial [Candidatus Brocadiia bacterium]|nr:hypothetical protein [Candidatus Brocadiia bacterium]
LLHVPVFIGHGSADHLLNVDQSRLMTKLLQERKQDVKYVEFPGETHYIWSKTFEHPELKARLAKWRRPAAPARVQFKTYTLKHNRAYWVQINAIAEWGKPASVDAQVASRNRIEITASNVATLTLTPGKDLLDLAKPVEVVVNGGAAQMTPAQDGSLLLTLVAGEKGGLAKTPSLCGPARQAYEAPFIIVAPTQKAPALGNDVQLTQQVAMDWYRYAQGAPVVRRDTEITPEDIAECNLIVCGSPETNAIYRRIAPNLPIQLTETEYVLGERRVPRQGAGMVLLYPNPLAPQRAVLVCQGLAWGKSLSTNHKYDFLPDFVIFTKEVDRDGTMFESNRALCAGYFDSAWRLNPSTTW